jgi:hypothetical protein
MPGFFWEKSQFRWEGRRAMAPSLQLVSNSSPDSSEQLQKCSSDLYWSETLNSILLWILVPTTLFLCLVSFCFSQAQTSLRRRHRELLRRLEIRSISDLPPSYSQLLGNAVRSTRDLSPNYSRAPDLPPPYSSIARSSHRGVGPREPEASSVRGQLPRGSRRILLERRRRALSRSQSAAVRVSRGSVLSA